MNTKILILTLSWFTLNQINCSYMNDEEITVKTILTGDCCTSIDYNILNDGNGNIGGNKRFYGIHNMSLEISGYEVINLIKDDICLYPHLFTILNNILSNNNMLVQRWACVKWWLPLTFGFKVKNNALNIYSSIWKYRFLSWARAKETIPLVKKSNFDENQSEQDAKIIVSINGRSVMVKQKTMVQVYSFSSLHPYAVLARTFFL